MGSAYSIGQLSNPSNDAQDLANSLRAIGLPELIAPDLAGYERLAEWPLRSDRFAAGEVKLGAFTLAQPVRDALGRWQDLPAQITALKHKIDVNTLEHHAAKTLQLNEVGNINLALARTVAIDPYAENRDTGGFIVIDRFTNLVSYDQLRVVVETEERAVSANLSAQQGLASLIGLIMASSGCPRTAVFRPMARFHLPFSSTRTS